MEEIKAAKKQAINSFSQTTPNLKIISDGSFSEALSKRNSMQISDHVFEDFGGIPNSYDSYGFRNVDSKRNQSPQFSQASNLDIRLLDQEKVSLVQL